MLVQLKVCHSRRLEWQLLLWDPHLQLSVDDKNRRTHGAGHYRLEYKFLREFKIQKIS